MMIVSLVLLVFLLPAVLTWRPAVAVLLQASLLFLAFPLLATSLGCCRCPCCWIPTLTDIPALSNIKCSCCWRCPTFAAMRKFSSYIRKLRMEQLQSHIWLTAFSYMVKYLRISSYIRKPFLVYNFATAPRWISCYMRKTLYSSLSLRHLSVNCNFANILPMLVS